MSAQYKPSFAAKHSLCDFFQWKMKYTIKEERKQIIFAQNYTIIQIIFFMSDSYNPTHIDWQ